MLERINIVRAGAGERPTAWREALAEPGWLRKADLLKSEGDAWVRRTSLLGRDVVIKCRRLHGMSRLKAAIRAGRSERHWSGAGWLLAHDIATARPLALATANLDNAHVELFVMEHVAGRSLLEHMSEPPSLAVQHTIADSIGATIRVILADGRYNRDFKPSNIIMDDRDGTPLPTLIDCVAIRRAPRATDEPLLRMLTSLVLEPLGCGVLPRRALLMRGLTGAVGDADTAAQRTRIRELWRAVERRVHEHGDPTPRVNPLGASGTA